MRASELIQSLKRSQKFRITCPDCGERKKTSSYQFFTEESLSKGATQYPEEQRQYIEDLKKELVELKKTKFERIVRGTRSSNLGKILERFAPILPGFMHRPEDCVPLLDPIDYVAFNGLSMDKIDSITFMDVKCGAGRLSQGQKEIKKAIESGKVELDIIVKGKK